MACRVHAGLPGADASGGGCGAGTHIEGWQRLRRAVEDEEEPEELVEALGEDVLPHLAADQLLVAAVRLLQQQLRSGGLRGQRCTLTALCEHTHSHVHFAICGAPLLPT